MLFCFCTIQNADHFYSNYFHCDIIFRFTFYFTSFSCFVQHNFPRRMFNKIEFFFGSFMKFDTVVGSVCSSKQQHFCNKDSNSWEALNSRGWRQFATVVILIWTYLQLVLLFSHNWGIILASLNVHIDDVYCINISWVWPVRADVLFFTHLSYYLKRS